MQSNTQPSTATPYKNWAENVTYSTDKVLTPSTVEELQAILRNPAYRHVKVQGSHHTFNHAADTFPDGVFVSLEKFKSIEVGEDTMTIGAGVTYIDIIEPLEKAKKAINNFIAIPHVSVVGTMVTCSHGTGYNQQVQAAHVQSIEIVLADGSLRTVHKKTDPNFYFYILSFGCVCIITKMTISIIPEFKVMKEGVRYLPWETFGNYELFDKLNQSADHVTFLCEFDSKHSDIAWFSTRFQEGEPIPKSRITGLPKVEIKKEGSWVDTQPYEPCEVGNWHNRVLYFSPKLPMIPGGGHGELQSEFYVQCSDFVNAINDLFEIRHEFRHCLQTGVFRTVAPDNIPLSPAKGKRVIAIHFTWHNREKDVLKALVPIEKVLNKYNAKPHPGKLFLSSGKRMHELFGEDWVKLKNFAKQMDPTGKFQNKFSLQYFDENDVGSYGTYKL